MGTAEAVIAALVTLHTLSPVQQGTCKKVALEAKRQGVDAVVMVAIAYVESRCTMGAVSKRDGSVGPLQVQPKNLRKHGPDVIVAGVTVYKRFRSRASSEQQAFCFYNGGYRCPKASKEYAAKVAALVADLRGLVKAGGVTTADE